jgi:hypothetical protein
MRWSGRSGATQLTARRQSKEWRFFRDQSHTYDPLESVSRRLIVAHDVSRHFESGEIAHTLEGVWHKGMKSTRGCLMAFRGRVVAGMPCQVDRARNLFDESKPALKCLQRIDVWLEGEFGGGAG